MLMMVCLEISLGIMWYYLFEAALDILQPVFAV